MVLDGTDTAVVPPGDLLPECFQPSKYDVIVGWARQNYHHEGNQMLRILVRDNVPRYLAAKTKHDKGAVIVEILERIRKESPTGWGLVRQDPDSGRWHYIGTDKAKDKIGHALRKASRDYEKEGHRVVPTMTSAVTSSDDQHHQRVKSTIAIRLHNQRMHKAKASSAVATTFEDGPSVSKDSLLSSCESASDLSIPVQVVTIPSSSVVGEGSAGDGPTFSSHETSAYHRPDHRHRSYQHSFGDEAPPSPVPPPHLRRSSSPDDSPMFHPHHDLYRPGYHEHQDEHQHHHRRDSSYTTTPATNRVEHDHPTSSSYYQHPTSYSHMQGQSRQDSHSRSLTPVYSGIDRNHHDAEVRHSPPSPPQASDLTPDVYRGDHHLHNHSHQKQYYGHGSQQYHHHQQQPQQQHPHHDQHQQMNYQHHGYPHQHAYSYYQPYPPTPVQPPPPQVYEEPEQEELGRDNHNATTTMAHQYGHQQQQHHHHHPHQLQHQSHYPPSHQHYHQHQQQQYHHQQYPSQHNPSHPLPTHGYYHNPPSSYESGSGSSGGTVVAPMMQYSCGIVTETSVCE